MSFDPTDYLIINYNINTQNNEYKRILPFSDSSLYQTKLLTAKPLTAGLDVKRIYDVSLHLQHIDRQFQPGDTIAILPENDRHEVIEIFNRLSLKSVAELPYLLEIRAETTKKKPIIPVHIPNQGTLLNVFTKNLDLRTPPKKLFLKMLVRFATDTDEISKLQHLCSPKGSEFYNDFIINYRGLLHLLNSFPTCNPPVERLLEHLPPLQPRPYSISSSPLINPKELHFTFSVIELENNRKGLCSSWLETLLLKKDAAHKLEFYFRCVNSFRLPDNPLVPLVMIGPGTGIAPFIGFLQHRAVERKCHSKEFGCSWLFYGCRYLDRDFLYKTEIDEFLSEGVLTQLFCCSSRDKPEKVYVQDLIMKHSSSFVDKLLNENAIVYICGDTKNMAKQVQETIVNCLIDAMSWSLSSAEDYIKELVRTNRYIQDVWV